MKKKTIEPIVDDKPKKRKPSVKKTKVLEVVPEPVKDVVVEVEQQVEKEPEKKLEVVVEKNKEQKQPEKKFPYSINLPNIGTIKVTSEDLDNFGNKRYHTIDGATYVP